MYRANTTLSSRIMRCLLFIAAWQAPLPFWHNHGTLADSAAESAPWLFEHLQTHHQAVDPLSHVVFGWHLHFALPDSADEAPDASKPLRHQLAVMLGLPSWGGHAYLQIPCLSWPAGASMAEPPASLFHRSPCMARGGADFFRDFAAEMPLPVRLGVLRC